MSKYQEVDAQLTQERVALNGVERKVLYLVGKKKIQSRRETSLVVTAIQLASMWLEKAKAALGIESPYPQSFNPNSPVIEERADTNKEEFGDIEGDEVSLVKSLRAELKDLEKAIENDSQINLDHKKYQECITQAWVNCSQATMWLGMTLNAIKTASETKTPVKEKTPKAEKPTKGNAGKKSAAATPPVPVESPSAQVQPPPTENSVPAESATSEALSNVVPAAPDTSKSKKNETKSKPEGKKNGGREAGN